jgi:hypothetical protein
VAELKEKYKKDIAAYGARGKAAVMERELSGLKRAEEDRKMKRMVTNKLVLRQFFFFSCL